MNGSGVVGVELFVRVSRVLTPAHDVFCIMKISERAGLNSNLQSVEKLNSVMEEIKMDFRLWMMVLTG